MRKTYLVILGSLIVVVGLAMLALPGPGMVVILVGLVVLASAGVLWAAKLLVRTRERLPDPEPEKATLVHTTIARIDRHMEDIDAVETVREQDRVMREEGFQEDLVTSHSNEPQDVPTVERTLATDALPPPNQRIG